MVIEDVVECQGCGATITHLVCNLLPKDDDYYLCDSCLAERDEQIGDDTINCCPDCERPNRDMA